MSCAPRECPHTFPEYHLTTCRSDGARRAEAEAFIRARFLRSHGAHIATFMPSFLMLNDSAGALAAVAGFRSAAHEPLFLERYLTAPIEQELSGQVRAPVSRAQILEVGNFAALDPRCATLLMSFMPAFFLAGPARWIVFTATNSIRRMLASLGGHCVELGVADGACAAGGTDEWGRYYSADPRVMAGYLPSARRIPALWRRHGN